MKSKCEISSGHWHVQQPLSRRSFKTSSTGCVQGSSACLWSCDPKCRPFSFLSVVAANRVVVGSKRAPIF